MTLSPFTEEKRGRKGPWGLCLVSARTGHLAYMYVHRGRRLERLTSAIRRRLGPYLCPPSMRHQVVEGGGSAF